MNESKFRTLSVCINLATALSVIIAAVALYLNVREINKKEFDADLSRWQESIIYNAICENPNISFKELQSKYIEAATKYGLNSLPKKSLQDVELERILLSLMSSGIIEKNSKNNYMPVYRADITQLNREWHKILKAEQTRVAIRAKILSLVEKESGKYTLDKLYVKMKEQNDNIDYETIAALVGELRDDYLVYKTSEGTLRQTYAYKYEREEKRDKLRSKIQALLEENSEQYTIASLYIKLKEQNTEADFEMMVDLIGELRYKRLIYKSKKGILHTTYGFKGEHQ